MSWVTRLEKLGATRTREVDGDLQDTLVGSCKTPKAMSSARRKPGPVPKDAALTSRG